MRSMVTAARLFALALVLCPAVALADGPTERPVVLADGPTERPAAHHAAHPPPALAPSAPLGRLSIGLGALTAWRLDSGFTAFAANPSTAPEVSVGFVLFEPAPHFSFAPELSAHHEERSAQLLQAANAQLELDVVSVGAVLRWEPLHWLAPFVRGTVGLEHHSLDVAGTLSGDGFALVGSFGAGLELDLPLGAGLTSRGGGTADAALGFFVEGGLFVGTRDALVVTPRTPTGELPADVIAASSVRLGGFDQTAPYLRVGVLLRL